MPWHPMVVHFPIVCGIASALIQWRRPTWARMAWGGTAILAALAVLTGVMASQRVAPTPLLVWHRDLGLGFLALATALWWRNGRLKPHPYLVLLAAVAGLLLLGVADLGGQLVYRQGVGVTGGAQKLGDLLYQARCQTCHGSVANAFTPGTVEQLGGVAGTARFITRNMPPGGPHPGWAEALTLAQFLNRHVRAK